MFSLFYYHLASSIRRELDGDTVVDGIRAFGAKRGERLRELDRRSGREPSAQSLIENGDLFLDPRCKKDVDVKDAMDVEVKVRRCVFAEVCNCHEASYEGSLYCWLVYQTICKSYCPGMAADVGNACAAEMTSV